MHCDYLVQFRLNSTLQMFLLTYKCMCLKVELVRRDYVGNEGWETFLSYEDPQQDILVGLLRLRKLSDDTFRPELKGGCSMVRELHVYGSVVPVSSRDPTKFQHQVVLLFLEFVLYYISLDCRINFVIFRSETDLISLTTISLRTTGLST